MDKLYKTANTYFQERFGCKVYKLALDGGMTCPNRDGTLGVGGCIFCSSGGSGEFAEKPCGNIALQIARAKERLSGKMRAGFYIAYFQSYTNTYADIETLKRLFYPAIQDPCVVGLSIATRPDCLPPDVLALLFDLNQIKPVFIELGLQTIHEETAQRIRRGYSLPVYDRAIRQLQQIGVHIITHMILGLPGETPAMIAQTAQYIGDCGSHGIKLQLLQILRNTELAQLYEKGLVQPLSKEAYIAILCDCIRRLPPGTVLHRLTGDAPRSLLIEPRWALDKKRVLQEIRDALKVENILIT